MMVKTIRRLFVFINTRLSTNERAAFIPRAPISVRPNVNRSRAGNLGLQTKPRCVYVVSGKRKFEVNDLHKPRGKLFYDVIAAVNAVETTVRG